MPCPGRCDDPVPVLSEGRVDIYGANGEVTTPPSALPCPQSGRARGMCVLLHSGAGAFHIGWLPTETRGIWP